MQNWLASLTGKVLNQQIMHCVQAWSLPGFLFTTTKVSVASTTVMIFFNVKYLIAFSFAQKNCVLTCFWEILKKYTVVLDKFWWTLVNNKVFKFNQCRNKKLHTKSGLVSLTWSGMFHLSVQNHFQALHTVLSFQATLMHKSCQGAYP